MIAEFECKTNTYITGLVIPQHAAMHLKLIHSESLKGWE